MTECRGRVVNTPSYSGVPGFKSPETGYPDMFFVFFSPSWQCQNSTVTNSQVLFQDGSLLHSKFSTQLLITVSNYSRILTHAQLLLVF
jgi:hypothetical protein